MLSHCSEIRFSGRLNFNLNPFHLTDSNTSNIIDIKWITGPSASYFCSQRRSFAFNRPEIPEMTTNSESGHASTRNVFSLKENLAIIRIIQGIGYVYTKQNSRSHPVFANSWRASWAAWRKILTGDLFWSIQVRWPNGGKNLPTKSYVSLETVLLWKTHPIVNWGILGRHTDRITGKLIQTKCHIWYVTYHIWFQCTKR